MNGNDDHDLKRRFANLRRAVANVTPPFAHMRHELLERPSPSHVRMPRLGLALASVFVLVIVVFATARLTSPTRAPSESALASQVLAGHWVAPTDFLLDFPGASYLRTVPRIGVRIDRLTPRVPTPSEKTRDSRNQS